jgi:MFS transporter, MHS family, shikimate and dehydroshikimate transport protein
LFAARATEMKRVLIASIIGTAVEWYDFIIYATASALVFTKLFFPFSNPGLSAIASFGTLGVGYFARPRR